MTKITLLSASLAAMLGALLLAAPAQAVLNNKSFMSSTGSGTTCDRANPCNTFSAAHDATVAGGEINCLDSGPFSLAGLSINKSITIDCAGMAATAINFDVNGPGIVVRIRNLTFNGRLSPAPGIEFSNGAALFVENCVFDNFIVGPAVGIRFRPSASGSQLVVTDTVLSNNGSGSVGGAIVVAPQSGGNAVVLLERVTVANNVYGIVADGSGSAAGIAMTIANSDVHRNKQDGIVATTPGGGAPIGIMVRNTRSLSNNIGIRSTGPGVTVRVDGATVMNNGTGLVFNLGGALLSVGNNVVQANGANGTFSGAVPLN